MCQPLTAKMAQKLSHDLTSLTVVVWCRLQSGCVRSACCFSCGLLLKYLQFASSVLATHSPHEHVDTLAQATVVCPLFCPPSKWFQDRSSNSTKSLSLVITTAFSCLAASKISLSFASRNP